MKQRNYFSKKKTKKLLENNEDYKGCLIVIELIPKIKDL